MSSFYIMSKMSKGALWKSGEMLATLIRRNLCLKYGRVSDSLGKNWPANSGESVKDNRAVVGRRMKEGEKASTNVEGLLFFTQERSPLGRDKSLHPRDNILFC